MAASIAGPPTVKRDAAELSTRVADERGELVVEETAWIPPTTRVVVVG